MNDDTLRRVLERVRDGSLDPDEALAALHPRAGGTTERLGFAEIDHDRTRRCGFPEVIYGAGKTPEEIAAIAERLWARGDRLLCTRAAPAAFDAVQRVVPDARYHERARVIHARRGEETDGEGLVAIVAAGTADLPVAEEARLTARLMDARVETYYDVGVAGVHRVLAHASRLREARALVVVAGMEGALPSVAGGLVERPVVAVPTSIGYGANFGGLSALLGMLNSCAANVCVVNIDNGFGGGYVAALINRNRGRDECR